MHSRVRQRKKEAEWLARGDKQRQAGGSRKAGSSRVAEQQEARKVYRRQAEAAKRHTEEAHLQSRIKKGRDTEARKMHSRERQRRGRQGEAGRRQSKGRQRQNGRTTRPGKS
jgi:hypothetical protein